MFKRRTGMTDSVHVRLTVSRGFKYTSGLDPRINTRACPEGITPMTVLALCQKWQYGLVTGT